MRKRQARREAEILWGENYHLESYRCRKRGCKHEGCTGPTVDARSHYRGGYFQEATGVLAKTFVVMVEGNSWDDIIKARA